MTAAKARFRSTGEVLTWWLGRLEVNRSVSPRYRDTLGSLLRRHVLPALGKVPVKKLTRADVDDKLIWPMQAAGLSPHTAHKALQGLQQAMVMAAKQRRIESNPLASVCWADFWTGKLQPRPAGLLPMDIQRVLPDLCSTLERDPVAGMLALMMLAHGTRIGETCRARWQHISLPDRIWVLPVQNTKTDAELVVPLTDQVCALLSRYRELQHPARRSSPWVFAMASGEPVSDSQASAMFRQMSQRQWRSHDLRKVARTCWAELGVDYLVGELMLNHAMGKIASTYIKTGVDQARREALEKWHGWLDARGFAAAHGLKSTETGFSSNHAAA